MRNNHGFTLVEILASIVILALLATVFFQMFIFSQKTTTGNQEKLVAINIAQGVLERLKNGAYPEITNPGIYSEDNCISSDEKCINKYKINVNNLNYSIKIEVSEELESGIDLHSAEVKVYDDNGKIESKVKGFVEL